MWIREATVEDWPEIWPFFSQIVSEGETYAYPLDLSSEAGRSLWFDDASRVIVACDDERILGTARMGANRAGNGDHVATASFMVDQASRSAGVGRELGEAMIRWAREQGFAAIQFNAVVESNVAAVRLWESLGFRIVGTVPRAFRSPSKGLVGIHVMHLSFEGDLP